MVLVAVLMLATFVPLAGTLRKRGKEKAPSGRANAAEAMIVYFRDEVVRANIGHGADAFTPFILTLFFFILGLNLIGLTPLGITPTAKHLRGPRRWPSSRFIVVEVAGFKALGPAGYARTIFFLPSGLPWFMKTANARHPGPSSRPWGSWRKPFALTIRLMANMTAGHTLILLLMGMIFVLQSYLMGVAAVAMGSVLMISGAVSWPVLQAYIFAMLTSVFIGLIRHAH